MELRLAARHPRGQGHAVAGVDLEDRRRAWRRNSPRPCSRAWPGSRDGGSWAAAPCRCGRLIASLGRVPGPAVVPAGQGVFRATIAGRTSAAGEPGRAWTGQSDAVSSVRPAGEGRPRRRGRRRRRACGRSRPPRRCGSPRPTGAAAATPRPTRSTAGCSTSIPTTPRASPAAASGLPPRAHRRCAPPAAPRGRRPARLRRRPQQPRRRAAGQRRLRRGAPACQRALRFDPALLEGHVNLGNLLRQKGDLDEAARPTSGDRAQPGACGAHYQLGLTLQALERLDAAAQSFERAIRVQPRHAEFHYSLGTVLHSMRRLDDALAAYERAIGLSPRCSRAVRGRQAAPHPRPVRARRACPRDRRRSTRSCCAGPARAARSRSRRSRSTRSASASGPRPGRLRPASAAAAPPAAGGVRQPGGAQRRARRLDPPASDAARGAGRVLGPPRA